MKIVFIADFAAIQQDSQSKLDDKDESCILVYNMVRKCILQILIYLKQSTSNHDRIHVGIKSCDSRAEYQIPRHIANSKREFHEYAQNDVIKKLFSAEYNEAHSQRQHTYDTNKQTPISRSRSSHSRSQLTTPTTSITNQLRHQSGLAQIVIALYQCMKQYEWSDTLLTTGDDHDTLEPQMIFILSTIPNDNSIETIREWPECIKNISKKSIAVHFIHIASSFNACAIPFGANDETQFKYIQSMDMCLRQWSEGSIGCIPLITLWLAPILQFEQIFIQMFKHNLSLQLAQHDKFCQQVVRWSGNMTVSSSFKLDCELLSMEYSQRWRKSYNPNPSLSICNRIYDILHSNIQSLHMEGVMEDSCVRTMQHLPYISFIIRPKMNKNTKRETQRFQQLFVSSASHKVSFMVSFKGDENNTNMTGVMYAVIPSFIILKIYVGVTWHTASASIHSNLRALTLNHDPNLNGCIQSMLNRKQFTTNIRNSNNHPTPPKQPPNASSLDVKQKLKRGLKMLYAAQINERKQKRIQKQQQKAQKETHESNTNTNNNNDIDLSHMELSLTANESAAQKQYKHLCSSLMNIYRMLLSKQTLKSQHLFAFIDITYQSFVKLCTGLFGERTGRAKVKLLLRNELFLDPLQFITTRKHLSTQQQLFDIKLQILLLAEYGRMHFNYGQRVDPLAKFKCFEAFLQRLEIKDTSESFHEFVRYLMEHYAHQLPKTFAQYYENREEDVPECITQHLQTINITAATAHPTLPMLPITRKPHHKKNKRKRRYSAMITDDSTTSQPPPPQRERDTKRFKKSKKKAKTQRSSKSKLKNVIITPMLATKTNPNQKIVSNTSRRTLTRSQRGGVIRSGKRPLRLVLGDKTNANQDTPRTKRRKIDRHVMKKKAALTKSSTVSTTTHVFASNTHNHNHAPITGSQIKKRSTQWYNNQRVQKTRISNRQSKRHRPKNKKTPPLKRHMTQQMDGITAITSRTQSLDNLMSVHNVCSLSHNNHNTNSNSMEEDENVRGHSLPTTHPGLSQQNAQTSMSEDTSSSSPLFLPQCTRTQSLVGFGDSFQFAARLPMGGEDEGEDQRKQMINEIHSAMDDHLQDWIQEEPELLPPAHMVKNVYIHEAMMQPAQFAQFVASSNNNSIAPMTPDLVNIKRRSSHCFTPFGYSGDRRSLIPETPDLMASGDGNGASNIRSNCKVNLRDTLCSAADADDLNDIMTNLPFT